MISAPPPLCGYGTRSLAMAAAMSALTAGRSRTLTESKRMNRFREPEPPSLVPSEHDVEPLFPRLSAVGGRLGRLADLFALRDPERPPEHGALPRRLRRAKDHPSVLELPIEQEHLPAVRHPG